MNPPRVPPAALLLLPAVLAAGAFAGWHLAAPAPDVPVAFAQATRMADRTAAPAAKTRPGPPPEVLAALAILRAADGAQAREDATMALVASLSPQELLRWLVEDWFALRSGFAATLFEELATRRLRAQTPDLWAEWAAIPVPMNNRLKYSPDELLAWAGGDPVKLDDLFRRHPNALYQMAVLEVLAETNPAAALASLQAMVGMPGNLADQCSSMLLLEKLAVTDPVAVEAARAWLPDPWQAEAATALAIPRLEASMSGELARLSAQPDGLADLLRCLNRKPSLATQLSGSLDQIPAKWLDLLTGSFAQVMDLTAARGWLEGDLSSSRFSPDSIAALQGRAAGLLAETDPALAISLMNGTTASPAARQEMLRQILASVSTEDGQAVLATLSPEERAEVMPEPGGGEDSTVPDPPLPASAPEWLRQLDSLPAPAVVQQLMRERGRWDADNAGQLVAGFQSLPDAQKDALAAALSEENADWLARSTGYPFMAQALTWSAGRPAGPGEEPDPASHFSFIAAGWVKDDPAAATAWVGTLPAGAARNGAIAAMASRWQQYDPPAVQAWIASLPPADRPAAAAALKR